MVLSVDGAALSALLLASVRVVAWLAVVPPFATRGIPAMAKVVLALGLSLTMAPTLATQDLPSTTPGLLMATVAQALIGAPRTRLQAMKTLRCTFPYPQEGLVRRLAQQAGAELLDAQHGVQVTLSLRLPDDAASALASALDEACQGRIGWLVPDPDA